VLLCSAGPTALLIILGNFNFLVTFYGKLKREEAPNVKQYLTHCNKGISQYLFLMLSILGIYQIRKRAAPGSAQYQTATAFPIIFCITSGFLILRGILNSPLQGVGVVVLTAGGWALYHYTFVPLSEEEADVE